MCAVAIQTPVRKCHTLDWLRNFISTRGADSVGAMYHELGHKNIKLIFVPGKLLLSGMKVPNFNDPMAAECNGLVYSTTEDRILVLPPPLCSTKININDVRVQPTDRVYRVLDGTVLNMYYIDGAWAMSTTNSIDATDANISNQILTNRYNRPAMIHYQQLFDEAVAQYADFDKSRLDTRCCYSIVMFHHAIHPFVHAYETHVWLVRCTNTTTFEESVPDIGLPIQQMLESVDSAEMQRMNSRALAAFVADSTIEPHFGYIIRRDSGHTGPNNIILPSTLFECIKTMCYESNLNRIIKTNDYDKYLYIAVNSFMHTRDNIGGYNKFVIVLGDSMDLYGTFTKIVNRVADRIIMQCNNITLPDDPLTHAIYPIATNCYKYFRATRDVRADANRLRAAVIAVIVHQRYTTVYYDLMLPQYYDYIYAPDVQSPIEPTEPVLVDVDVDVEPVLADVSAVEPVEVLTVDVLTVESVEVLTVDVLTVGVSAEQHQ